LTIHALLFFNFEYAKIIAKSLPIDFICQNVLKMKRYASKANEELPF